MKDTAASQAIQATPAATYLAALASGFQIQVAVAWLGGAFILLQFGYLAWKWLGEMRHRRAQSCANRSHECPWTCSIFCTRYMERRAK